MSLVSHLISYVFFLNKSINFPSQKFWLVVNSIWTLFYLKLLKFIWRKSPHWRSVWLFFLVNQ